MQQVLFRLPFYTAWTPNGVPVYGFGTMLFLTFLVTVWLASRRAEREGVSRDRILDMALWIFIGGIAGARIVYMIQYGRPWTEFLQIWQGGIVFYGSLIGGWLGYALYYLFALRREAVSTWQIADIVAPSIAVGLLLGRIGCFLNGCCYGHIAGEGCPAVHFPMLTSLARDGLVQNGYQTLAGFSYDDKAIPSTPGAVVGAVELGSAADRAGLKPGDIITHIDGYPMTSSYDVERTLLGPMWPRGKNDVELTVTRAGTSVTLPPFVPRTIGLHPTQLYESISMAILFVVLLTFYPLRRHYGQVFVLFLVCYAIHRFVNEQLRNDTDPVAFGLTLSQNISIGILFTAGLLEAYLRVSQPRLPNCVPRPTVDPASA